jgi:hypothetical protein
MKIYEGPPEPRRVWTQEEKMRLLDMKLSGWSLCRLATKYDVPPYEIREALEDIVRQVGFGSSEHRDGSHKFKPIRRYGQSRAGRLLKAIYSCQGVL